MISRMKRLNERDWDVLDRVLAALLFVVLSVDLALGRHHGPLAAELLVAAGITVALLWRRRHALLSAIAAMAGAAALLTLFTSPAHATSVIFVVIIVGYSTGAHLELRRSLLGFALIAGAVAAVCVIKTPNDVIFPIVFFGIVPWAVGRVIRTQTVLARELAEKAEREEIARDEDEARAAAAERARVARELHDVLAHNLSLMVIQASAARRVASQDPAAVVEAAELISRTGREALSELRYVFGPVRKEQRDVLGAYNGDTLGSSPGLAHLEQLASRAHRAGVPVELRVEGTPLQLSPGADLAAYRVVQEALTNTLKHAHGAQATVTVRYGSRDVVIEVVDNGVGATPNGGSANGGGHGLVGMRERVALYGGELEAGPRRKGGFAIRARIPAEEPSPLTVGGTLA
jgi:signal transduction histidine kinase